MQLSTNLPTSLKQYDSLPGTPLRLPMNVSRESDASFMAELKRTDPVRHRRLVDRFQKAHYQAEKQRRRCWHCGLVLPPDIRSDALYCDSTCQRDARRSRKAA